MPACLAASPALEELRLENNALSGQLPALPQGLQLLELQGNKLSGTIPPLPPKLVYLDLSSNEFSGNVPAAVPPGLLHASFRQNGLGQALVPLGQALPAAWMSSPSLLVLDVSHNRLGMDLGSTHWSASNLHYLVSAAAGRGDGGERGAHGRRGGGDTGRRKQSVKGVFWKPSAGEAVKMMTGGGARPGIARFKGIVELPAQAAASPNFRMRTCTRTRT